MTVLELSGPVVTSEARAQVTPIIDWLLADARNEPDIPHVLDSLGPRLICPVPGIVKHVATCGHR